MHGRKSEVRIKDIADVEGIRENQLVGYGLVVGLNGTGDKLDNAVFTKESLVGMLERLGVNTRDQIAKLQTKNVAAVMVTADLPAFARSRQPHRCRGVGDRRRDEFIRRHAAGDTDDGGGRRGLRRGAGRDLHRRGGCEGRRRQCYAQRSDRRQDRQRRDRRARGAVSCSRAHASMSTWLCAIPDLTTARRIAAAVNAALGAGTARATDPRTVALQLRGAMWWRRSAEIEELRVQPDMPAVVIIDEASGTIVMGANVRISTVAIAQGNLTIRVTETPEVCQPGPLSNGTTTTVPRSNIQVERAERQASSAC